MRHVIPAKSSEAMSEDEDDETSQSEEDSWDGEDEDEDSNDDDDAMGEDDVMVPGFGDEEIKVEFEAFPPSDQDASGLTSLLVRLFHKECVNVTQLVDSIISHNYVGSVLKANSGDPQDDESESGDDNDEAVYGLTTVVNLTITGNSDQFKEDIQKYLAKFCDQEDLWKVLNDKSNSVGLLLTERFINIPPLLAPPMLKFLNKEIETAAKKKLPYNFTHYLLITKSCDVGSMDTTGSSGGDLPPELEFLNPEDQLFQQFADLVLSFPVPSGEDLVGGNWGKNEKPMKQYRTVLLLNKTQYKLAVTKIADVFNVNNLFGENPVSTQ